MSTRPSLFGDLLLASWFMSVHGYPAHNAFQMILRNLPQKFNCTQNTQEVKENQFASLFSVWQFPALSVSERLSDYNIQKGPHTCYIIIQILLCPENQITSPDSVTIMQLYHGSSLLSATKEGMKSAKRKAEDFASGRAGAVKSLGNTVFMRAGEPGCQQDAAQWGCHDEQPPSLICKALCRPSLIL